MIVNNKKWHRIMYNDCCNKHTYALEPLQHPSELVFAHLEIDERSDIKEEAVGEAGFRIAEDVSITAYR